MELGSITSLLKSIYNVVTDCCYWYFGAKTVIGIIKNSNDTDWRGALKSLGSGCASYGSCHLVMVLFDEIKRTFNH